MTTVVHVRTVRDRLKAGDPDIVYIGRAMPRQRLPESMWANPYKIGAAPDETREYCIAQYRAYIVALLSGESSTAAEWWQDQLRMLRGKTLACWCKPDACHGDVLAELAETA